MPTKRLRCFERMEDRLSLDAQMLLDTNMAPLPFRTDSFAEHQGELYFAVNFYQQTQTLELSDFAAELWKTDGTAEGTVLVDKLQPRPDRFTQSLYTGSVSTRIKNVSSHGDALAVISQTERGGPGQSDLTKSVELHLFGSDGIESSTLIEDGWPYTHVTRDPVEVANGDLFFVSSAGGTSVVKLDRATATATKVVGGDRIRDLIRDLVAVGDNVYFALDADAFCPSCSGHHGEELYVTGGNVAGARLVSNIRPGRASSSPRSLVAVDGRMFFTADDGVNGRELWMTDGTAEGTQMVEDFSPGAGRTAEDIHKIGHHVLLVANTRVGQRLLAYDTEAASHAVLLDKPVQDLMVSEGRAYFTVKSADATEIWQSDGTGAGTERLGHGPQGVARLLGVGDSVMAVVGGRNASLVAIGQGSSFKTIELQGRLVTDQLQRVGNLLFFFVEDEGMALWRTDGTAEGTWKLRDIEHLASPLGAVDGLVVFLAGDEETRLWRSDGTVAGTFGTPIDRARKTESAFVIRFIAAEDMIYFVAARRPVITPSDSLSSGHFSGQLWRTDGTPEGTVLTSQQVFDIIAYVAVDDGLAFTTGFNWEPNQIRFWHAPSDGEIQELTDEEFRSLVPERSWERRQRMVLRDIKPVEHDGRSYFSNANDPRRNLSDALPLGVELTQATDGQASLIADINPGPLGSYPREFLVADDLLFFTASDGVHGFEPWVLTLPKRGDVDGDRHVTLADFEILAANFGKEGIVAREDGDLDGDGRVGFQDFLEVAASLEAAFADPSTGT